MEEAEEEEDRSYLLLELFRVSRLLYVLHLCREDVDEGCRDHVVVIAAVDLQHVLTEYDVGLRELDRIRRQCCEHLVCRGSTWKYVTIIPVRSTSVCRVQKEKGDAT